MQHLTLDIEGMSCGHCLNAVNRALTQLPGVEIESIRMGHADVRYDEHIITPAKVQTAITDAGYRATSRP